MSDIQKVRAGAALGECVRGARRAAGLRQEDLARKAGVGTSTLRLIESGSATGTSLFAIFRLLQACGVPLAALEDVYRLAAPQPARAKPRPRGTAAGAVAGAAGGRRQR
ncbi:helix-turn-helix transcriptional regulator [Agromyces sp. NBRC 114283]